MVPLLATSQSLSTGGTTSPERPLSASHWTLPNNCFCACSRRGPHSGQVGPLALEEPLAPALSDLCVPTTNVRFSFSSVSLSAALDATCHSTLGCSTSPASPTPRLHFWCPLYSVGCLLQPQGFGKARPVGQVPPAPAFADKALLEHNHVYFLSVAYGCSGLVWRVE